MESTNTVCVGVLISSVELASWYSISIGLGSGSSVSGLTVAHVVQFIVRRVWLVVNSG